MIREVVVALREVTVAALAGHAGNHVDRSLRILHIRVLDRTPLRHLEGVARIGIEEKLPVGTAAALVEDLLLPRLPRELVALLVILDPVLARHPHTREREAVIDRHTVPHIHIAGAGATLDREPRTCAEQRHRNSRRKRQHAVVLQENDALLGRLPRENAMPLLPLGDLLGRRSGSLEFIYLHIYTSFLCQCFCPAAHHCSVTQSAPPRPQASGGPLYRRVSYITRGILYRAAISAMSVRSFSRSSAGSSTVTYLPYWSAQYSIAS